MDEYYDELMNYMNTIDPILEDQLIDQGMADLGFIPPRHEYDNEYTPDYTYDVKLHYDEEYENDDYAYTVVNYLSDYDYVEDVQVINYDPYTGTMEVQISVINTYPGDVWEYIDTVFQSLDEYGYVTALNYNGTEYKVYGIIYKMPPALIDYNQFNRDTSSAANAA